MCVKRALQKCNFFMSKKPKYLAMNLSVFGNTNMGHMHTNRYARSFTCLLTAFPDKAKSLSKLIFALTDIYMIIKTEVWEW